MLLCFTDLYDWCIHSPAVCSSQPEGEVCDCLSSAETEHNRCYDLYFVLTLTFYWQPKFETKAKIHWYTAYCINKKIILF